MASDLAAKKSATLEANKRKSLKKTVSKNQRSLIDMLTRKKTSPAMPSGVQKDPVPAVSLDQSDSSDVESDSGSYSSSSNSDELDI